MGWSVRGERGKLTQSPLPFGGRRFALQTIIQTCEWAVLDEGLSTLFLVAFLAGVGKIVHLKGFHFLEKNTHEL